MEQIHHTAMAPPFIEHHPAVEERVSPRQAARRARMSRRSDRRAALHAFEQQQLQLQQPGLFNPHNIFQQPGLFNPHNIFQQPQQQQHYQHHQQPEPEPLLVRPLPVPPTPANPASRRQRRKASRLSRERREARIRAGYVVGGKTRRRHRRRN